MDSIDAEEIDRAIKILKEILDFYNNLEIIIEEGIIGYELKYKVDQFERHIKKKEKRFEDSLWDKYELEGLDTSDINEKVKHLLNFIGIYHLSERILISFGTKKIRDLRENKNIEYSKLIRDLNVNREVIINRIGYLEFLKQKPKPKEIQEKIGYEEDLEDFIAFLDEKFKEWEKLRIGKKD